MRFLGLAILVLTAGGCLGEQIDENYFSRFLADLWLEGSEVVRIIWRDCSRKLVEVKDVIDHKEYFPKFVRCMKRKTLRALDRTLSTDVVPVADGVNLVRFEMVDKSGNVLADNNTASYWTEKDLDDGEWRTLALQRIAKVLRTHVLKFEIEDVNAPDKVEYRGRRRHHMMTMMIFGIVCMGLFVVPMGFQFLAVLGGKALLLAKMALILASIQGLKKVDHSHFEGLYDRGKISASPLNGYGFYPTYPYEYYQKRSNNDWPPPSLMPPKSPPSMSSSSWPSIETGDIKVDRIHIAPLADNTNQENDEVISWKSSENTATDIQGEPRLYPVYQGAETSAPVFTAIDSPTPLVDLTTSPGQVQADYSIEMPYNGFRFQSPTSVVSS